MNTVKEQRERAGTSQRAGSFYIISTGPRLFREIHIPQAVIIVFVAVMVFSIIGFCKTLSFIASYGYSKLGLYYLTNENINLLSKIRFLNILSNEYTARIEQLAAYDDVVRLKFGLTYTDTDAGKEGSGPIPSNEELEEIVSSSFGDPIIKDVHGIERTIEQLLHQVKGIDRAFNATIAGVASLNEQMKERPSIWPAQGRITSSFGSRTDPIFGDDRFHEGIDIANHKWTPIYATADGMVTEAGNKGNYGNTVVINHKSCDLSTLYAHLVQSEVLKGELIKRGDIIGYMGSTGKSTGPHLHYEIRKDRRVVNPTTYILPLEQVVD